jgi:hypothetical protein
MEPKTQTPKDDENEKQEKTTPNDEYSTPGKNDYSTPGNENNSTPGNDEEFGNYKILNYFEGKDFFLVSNNNNKKNCSENNYFLKRISLNKKANKNVLYEK